MKIQQKPFKNIMSDFTATHNPFNQNLNYEKILRFSPTKVSKYFIVPKYFNENITIFALNIVKKIHFI